MNLNKYIDHTLLKPEATAGMIDNLCAEAKQYDFASVCVNPMRIGASAGVTIVSGEAATGSDY